MCLFGLFLLHLVLNFCSTSKNAPSVDHLIELSVILQKDANTALTWGAHKMIKFSNEGRASVLKGTTSSQMQLALHWDPRVS